MFEKQYEERMTLWREFRSSLEESPNPIQAVIDFYNHAPPCRLATDPYDRNTWPNPWEILEENTYCDFVKILAICYTLQLTEVLKQENYEIHIARDYKNCETYYLLYVGNTVVGFTGDTHVQRNELPTTLRSECVYALS
tara:strand:- start:237 stop:653 length:417 start_codon:yes stop_codon:yes gene_type:complete